MKLPFSPQSPHVCEWKDRADELQHLLQSVAVFDPRTGLGNGPQFEREVVRMSARQQRTGEPFTVALLEVRGVHAPQNALAGEELSQISDRLVDTLRLEDHASFLGVNQFGVVLGNATLSGAGAFIERCCARVGGTPITGPNGPQYLQVYGGASESCEAVHGIGELHSGAKSALALDIAARHALMARFGRGA